MAATLRAELFDPTFTTNLGTLIGRDISGQVQLSDVGASTVVIPLDDPLADSIDDDLIVRISTRHDPTGAPTTWTPIHAGAIRRYKRVEKATAGGPARGVHITAPTWVARLSKSKVRPGGGIGPATFDDVRRFDWTSPELDTSGWADAEQRTVVGDRDGDPPDGLKGLPESYPNRLVYWLGPTAAGGTNDPAGTMWVHGEYTNAADATNYHYTTADDTFSIARNGVPLVSFTDDTATAAADTFYRGLREAAGDHIIRAEVTNSARPGNPHNAHLFAWSCAEREFVSGGLGVELDETWVASTSDVGWKATTDPADVQFTWGAMFLILLGEAQDDGELDGVTTSFSATVDSDGNAWPTGTFVWSADDSLLDVLRKSHDAGWIEWLADPETLELHAWVPGNEGATRALTYSSATAAISGLDHDVDFEPMFDRVNVRDAYGWFERGTGDRVETLKVPQITDRSEAERLADEYLARSGEPSLSTSFTASPSASHAFRSGTMWVGDRATIPALGGATVEQLKSLSFQHGDACTKWTAEWVSMRRAVIERLARIARRTASGSLGGRSEMAAPTSPFQPAPGRVQMDTITWSQSGNAAAQTSGIAVGSFAQPTRIMTVEIRASGPADPTTTGDTGAEVYVGGDLVAAVELLEGETIAKVDVATAIAQKDEAVELQLYAAGNHAGLRFTVTGAKLPQ